MDDTNPMLNGLYQLIPLFRLTPLFRLISSFPRVTVFILFMVGMLTSCQTSTGSFSKNNRFTEATSSISKNTLPAQTTSAVTTSVTAARTLSSPATSVATSRHYDDPQRAVNQAQNADQSQAIGLANDNVPHQLIRQATIRNTPPSSIQTQLLAAERTVQQFKQTASLPQAPTDADKTPLRKAFTNTPTHEATNTSKDLDKNTPRDLPTNAHRDFAANVTNISIDPSLAEAEVHPVHLTQLTQPMPSSQTNTFAPLSPLPSHVVLLIPKTGPLARTGHVIERGFLSAYYAAKQQGIAVPKVDIIDSHVNDIHTAYRRALAMGADFIIGPLTKSRLTALIHSTRFRVPTLALNTLTPPVTQHPIKNLYQFGLSPQDEIQQATQRMQADQHERLIVINPNNPWGKTLSDTLIQRWQHDGGIVSARLSYGRRAVLANGIRELLNIDLSERRYHELKKILHTSMHFVPRRRQDVDAIYVIASPSIAREIRPLLRYYYAGHVATYALSQVFQGNPNATRDHDLDDIIFCDMPWVLAPNTSLPPYLIAIHHMIQHTWANAFQQYPKRLALGVDAFNLMGQLNRLQTNRQLSIPAATGYLSLDKQHHLYRQLIWAKIHHGKPQRLMPSEEQTHHA